MERYAGRQICSSGRMGKSHNSLTEWRVRPSKPCSLEQIKLLWLLLFRKESVWVAWIQDNVIKDESIWEIKPRQSHTWIFKRILAERETVLKWIRISPGNGSDVKFWLDPWTQYGRLITFIGAQGPPSHGHSTFHLGC